MWTDISKPIKTIKEIENKVKNKTHMTLDTLLFLMVAKCKHKRELITKVAMRLTNPANILLFKIRLTNLIKANNLVE